MSESVIMASAKRFYDFIVWLYLQSSFKKGFDRIEAVFGSVFRNSVVFQILWIRDYEEWKQGSRLHRWASKLRYISEVRLKHLSRWFDHIYRNSIFGQFLINYLSSWKKEGVGLLAISLASMGISSLAGLFIRNQLTKADIGILGFILILSGILFFLRNGLWTYIQHSFLYQFFCGFFWISTEIGEEEELKEENTFIYYVIHCILGIGLGGAYIFLPTILFGLAIAAMIAGIVILYDYKMGIYALIAALPLVELAEFALLLVVVIGAYVFHCLRKGTFGIGKGSILFTPLVLFTINLVIGAFTAVVPGGSSYGLKMNFTALLFALFFIVAVKDRKTLYRSIMSFVLTATAVSIIGIAQYGMPQNAAWTDAELNPEITSRVVGSFGNPNVFGQYLVLAIPFIVAMIFLMKKRINQLALWICLVLSIAGLALTYSRGSYVGFVVAVGLFIWIVKREWVFAGIPFLMISPFFLPSSLLQRISTIGNALQDSSVQHRLAVLQGSLDLIKDFGWFGIGPGGDVFKVIYPLYTVAWRKAAHPHNMFLQYIIELGAIGFILLLYMVWKLFKINLKNKENLLMVASATAIMGLLVNGLVEGLFFAKIILGFWMTIAISGKIGELSEKREELP